MHRTEVAYFQSRLVCVDVESGARIAYFTLQMAEHDQQKLPNEGALHVVWTFPFADSVSVSALHSQLVAGQKSRLFDIRLWDCRDGQVSAILVPEGPFEAVVAHIWSTGHKPSGLWVEEKPESGNGPTGNLGQPA